MTAGKPPAVPVLWVAGRDLVAHAYRKRGTRTACGLPKLDRRWAWPQTSWCGECRAALEEVATA